MIKKRKYFETSDKLLVKTVHEKSSPIKCLTQSQSQKEKSGENESVHEKSNLNKMKLNAAKFASIINNNNGSSKFSKTKLNKNTIAGINLDQNRFSELANLEGKSEGRFWDTDSNSNSNASASMSGDANIPKLT